jgi:uncharacterized membrane protein YphA (DoxX/SURF4 family)
MQSLKDVFTSPWIHWLALLLLCSAYLQGPLDKLRDFGSAVAEMQHFGLRPALPFAVFTIVFELVACAFILSGWHRWAGALALGGFTVFANFLADRFWTMHKPERNMVANAFFEHWGLTGGFLLVAWHDLGGRDVY